MNDLDIAVMTRQEVQELIGSTIWTAAFVRHLRRIVTLRPDLPINVNNAGTSVNCCCIKPVDCSWCRRLKP